MNFDQDSGVTEVVNVMSQSHVSGSLCVQVPPILLVIMIPICQFSKYVLWYVVELIWKRKDFTGELVRSKIHCMSPLAPFCTKSTLNTEPNIYSATHWMLKVTCCSFCFNLNQP